LGLAEDQHSSLFGWKVGDEAEKVFTSMMSALPELKQKKSIRNNISF